MPAKPNNQSDTTAVKPYKISTIGLGKERDVLLENISLLLGAGMTVSAALRTNATENSSPKMKKIINAMLADVDAGKPLWQAFEASRLFTPYTISLVRIGEESGSLAENIKTVAMHQTKERLFKSQLRSAMAYPILILCLTLVLGIGIAVFILPKLADVFSQLRVDLPLATKVLISTGQFFEARGVIIIPIVLGVVGCIVYLLFINRATKWIGQNFLFKIPILNRLMQEIELARFGYLLGGMLAAGLPITRALASFQTTTTYKRYRKFYASMAESIENGHSLKETFASYKTSRKLIPGTIQQLIIAGEQSGSLADSLQKVGSSFEAKTETTTKNFATMLEPFLLIIVWLGVIGVALGVILPIYSLIGGLNK